MKASIPYSTVLVFISTLTFGQNYQTIKSNNIHFFMTQSQEYFLATKVNEVQTLGSDSIFYPFQTIREDNTLTENDPCKFYLGSSWLGPKVEIKANGQNIFYNRYEEPIYIETQAALHDTFTVYNYPNGTDWIKGVVSNHVTLYVFGNIDSVKIVKLISNTELPYTNPRFILSKNYGLVEMFAPYSFPDPYAGASSVTGDNDYPSEFVGSFQLVGGVGGEGFQKPTVGDIHNHAIGDTYKYYSSHQKADGSFAEIFEEVNYINKFSWGADSVKYVTNRNKQSTHYPSNGGESYTTTSGWQTLSHTYYNLDQWNTPLVPEEFDGSNGWSVLLFNDCGDVEEVVRKQSISWDGASPCLTYEPYNTNYVFTFIKGAGTLAPTGSSVDGLEIFQGDLVYYEKEDGSTCGTNQYLAVKNEPKSEMKVYPNPTNGDLFLELDAPSSNTIITVIDKSGRRVRIWKVNTEVDHYLDVGDLEVGIYTLIVENESGVKQQRVIKN